MCPLSFRACAFAVLACASLELGVVAEKSALAGEPSPGSGGIEELGVDRARAAYARGVRANAKGDHASAARAFAEADALAPTAASLEAALESAMKADDALLGAELVDRADGRAADGGLRTSLEAARKRFAGRTGKIRIECHGGETRCLAAVDGAAADARKAIYVAAGPHAVVVQRGEERIERLVDVKADGMVVVAAPEIAAKAGASAGAGAGAGASARAGATAADDGGGISRGWFFVGLGVTAIVGGITLVSGLDAVSLHDRFSSDGCGSGTGPRPSDCDERGHAGERAQLRTNVLLGATAVLAVTTAAIGVFGVRWKDGTQARMTVGTSRGAGAIAGLEIVTP